MLVVVAEVHAVALLVVGDDDDLLHAVELEDSIPPTMPATAFGWMLSSDGRRFTMRLGMLIGDPSVA